jgi:hypothetical protein
MSGQKYNSFSRRDFLKIAAGALLLPACGSSTRQKIIPGTMVDPDSELGHRMRDGIFPAVVSTEETDTVILGGGISGLSAARWLHIKGKTDFVLLELAGETGGNAASGKNEITAYPWAAHYLPIPNAECSTIIDFLTEIGVITGTETGLPVYNEQYLCFEPQERLFIHGKWQDGLIPEFGISPKDRAEITRFIAVAEELRHAKGSDGKFAFAIPADDSSVDSIYRGLDTLTMTEYLQRENYSSEYLHWYINYCCLDDYGTRAAETSAWAGLHYFASRRGMAANAEAGSVLTWPEGNAFLAQHLRKPVNENIRTGCAAFSVVKSANGLHEISYYDAAAKQSRMIRAKKIISALPQFANKRLFSSYTTDVPDSFTYCPWVTANITVSNWDHNQDRPLSWDNVRYGSSSLGYVNAGHQRMNVNSTPTVFTWYHPVADLAPADARKLLCSKSYDQLQSLVLSDMKKMHSGCEQYIDRIDVRIWGHAMIRPVRNFMWSGARERAGEFPDATIALAHSDLSGISIFEEAFLRGIKAAEHVLKIT